MPEYGYASDFLTHFAGRELRDDKAYEVLCKIISDNRLLPRGSQRDSEGNVKSNPAKPFSSNDLLSPEIVCFCDIPLHREMLEIHTRKYSRFGIAFGKDWLAGQGASPVLYLAKGSGCTDHRFLPGHRLRWTNRKDFFDLAAGDWLNEHGKHGPNALNWPRGENMVFWYLLCYCKFFDETLPLEHEENYYMEREWRTIGQVSFNDADVQRVILPNEEYKGKFIEWCNQEGHAALVDKIQIIDTGPRKDSSRTTGD